MKRPLVLLALAYSGGLILGRWVPASLGALFGLCFFLALTVLLAGHRRPMLLWPLLVALGWVNLAARMAVLSPVDLRRLVGEEPALVALRGRLLETPSLRVVVQDETEVRHFLARLEIEALQRGGNPWEPAYGRVLVSTPGGVPLALFTGQPVEVSGVIRPPSGPVAEGLFDYRLYLQWQGVYHQLRVRSTNDWRVLADPGHPGVPPFADRFLTWAQATMSRGLPVEDEPLRLLWAMTLGWKTALTDEVSEPFMRTGTMHIFAISGLHIALIAGILVALFRVLQMPRLVCGLLVIPLIWFYTAATGLQASAIRSAVMMTIVIGGWMLRRPGDLLNSLAAAGLIIVLWDPTQLYQASFQLSFFVVLSLALLTPPIHAWFAAWLRPDPLLPRELLPRWRRWLAAPIFHVLANAAVSLAAFLGSLPLIAWYFHMITPVSLLANLVIVPLSSLALGCNLGSLVLGDWLPAGGVLFNHAAWFFMQAMVWLSDRAAAWPGAYWYVRAPSLAAVVVYYGLQVGLATGWLLAPPRRRWTALGASLLLCGAGACWLADRSTVRLTVLALEGGSAIFVDAPGHKHDLLIDCGNQASAERIVKPFLRAQGVNRLACLALTHGDIRHVGGAATIIDLFNPERVAASSARFRSPPYRRALESLAGTPARLRTLHRGESLAGWAVVHPADGDNAPQADDKALVLLGAPPFPAATVASPAREKAGDGLSPGVAGRQRVLLLSDLSSAGQSALLNRSEDLRAEVVITGLPAQGEPVADALLEAIRPQLLVVNDARSAANERASDQLRRRLARPGLTVLYTSETGTLTLDCRGRTWEVRSMRGSPLTLDRAGAPLPAGSSPAP
jgi:ComEC/Rec2-related protein